jgi:hypothetical protein
MTVYVEPDSTTHTKPVDGWWMLVWRLIQLLAPTREAQPPHSDRRHNDPRLLA